MLCNIAFFPAHHSCPSLHPLNSSVLSSFHHLLSSWFLALCSHAQLVAPAISAMQVTSGSVCPACLPSTLWSMFQLPPIVSSRCLIVSSDSEYKAQTPYTVWSLSYSNASDKTSCWPFPKHSQFVHLTFFPFTSL